MKSKDYSRRKFITVVSAGSATVMASSVIPVYGSNDIIPVKGKLAILGGDPVRKDKPWHSWPYIDQNVIDSIVSATKSGVWCRTSANNKVAATFEKEFSAMLGA